MLEIMKSDYISFLDKKMLNNYESTIIYGIIINNLKDIIGGAHNG